jgi:ABC-type lipoprotein release transport system permease subunit
MFILFSLFNRRRATTLSSFVTAVNLFLGVFVLIFIVVVQESRQKKTTTYEFETNM